MCLTLLIRCDGGDRCLPELKFCLEAEERLCAGDKGASQRHAHVAGLDELYDVVLVAFIFEGEFVLERELRLGVIRHLELNLLTYFR